MAVNREYADADDVLSPHDELALVPPVSGGETVLVHARVTDAPLSIDALAGLVRNPAAGAVDVVEGVTRAVQALGHAGYVRITGAENHRKPADANERHGVTAGGGRHPGGVGARPPP